MNVCVKIKRKNDYKCMSKINMSLMSVRVHMYEVHNMNQINMYNVYECRNIDNDECVCNMIIWGKRWDALFSRS